LTYYQVEVIIENNFLRGSIDSPFFIDTHLLKFFTKFRVYLKVPEAIFGQQKACSHSFSLVKARLHLQPTTTCHRALIKFENDQV